jgi:aryl-alcohol dehydrogenase-like predicted oxidoreductase
MTLTRNIGNSSLKVLPLALGGNVFGWTVDEKTSHEILDAFVGAGFNFIDTADMYSKWKSGNRGGESETIIGTWLKRSGKRADVVIATKLGIEMAPGEKGLSRAYIERAVERSLSRLQTDYIDLYQSHIDDKETPLEETLEAYSRLIAQGKVRVIGASNYDAGRLTESLEVAKRLGVSRYECLQPHYNLMERSGYEAGLEGVCLKNKIGVIPYFSLASGFLTGKYRSEADLGKSVRGGGMKKYLNERGWRVLAALDEVARRLGATPTKVALAWLMARPSVTAPIASATSVGQVRELMEAAGLKLDAEAVKALDEASAA